MRKKTTEAESPGRSKRRKYPRFGSDLEQLIANLGMDDREVADVLGVHPETVGRWRRGANRPQTSTLRMLASLLRVPIAQLRRDDKQHAHLPPVAPVVASTEEMERALQDQIRQPDARPRVIKVLKRSGLGTFYLGFLPSGPEIPDDFPIRIEGDLNADVSGDV